MCLKRASEDFFRGIPLSGPYDPTMAPRTVYHQGELEIQQRAGVRDLAAELQEYIRLAMPMQHAEFYAQQSMFFVGGR